LKAPAGGAKVATAGARPAEGRAGIIDTIETDLAELRERRKALEAETADLRAITEAVVLAAHRSGMSLRVIGLHLGLSEAHIGRLRDGRRSGRQMTRKGVGS